MSKRTAILWGILILIFGLIIYGSWYKNRYSMEKVNGFEINDLSMNKHLLIATQGSEYKDRIVSEITRIYDDRSIYIKVIDISELDQVDNSQWKAILIMHTWEVWKPPTAISDYFSQLQNTDNIVVLTTSGDGDYKMDGLDAITGASMMEEIPSRVELLKEKLDKLLDQ